jgi:uroporphyrinogen III methyltransferase / synthase
LRKVQFLSEPFNTANSVDSSGPLAGRRILITRPRSQVAAFARLIEGLGGQVVEFPTIEIVPPLSYQGLDRAIERVESYQWIIFTSVNGVTFFLNRARDVGKDVNCLREKHIAAIGPETAKELERNQIPVSVLPREYRAEAILDCLEPRRMRGQRVLLPRAAKAREVLPNTLRGWGAEVDVVEAYRTLPAAGETSKLRAELSAGKIDMVTFTSSSTVQAFVAFFTDAELKELMARVGVACIGPITRRRTERSRF